MPYFPLRSTFIPYNLWNCLQSHSPGSKLICWALTSPYTLHEAWLHRKTALPDVILIYPYVGELQYYLLYLWPTYLWPKRMNNSFTLLFNLCWDTKETFMEPFSAQCQEIIVGLSRWLLPRIIQWKWSVRLQIHRDDFKYISRQEPLAIFMQTLLVQ